MRLKVCGMRDPENIRSLFEVRPDMIGMIFYPRSRRYADGHREAICGLEWPDGIARVGVFVDEALSKVIEIAEIYNLQWIQLHGHEKPGDCLRLREKGLRIIKSFGVGEAFDAGSVKPYEGCADVFLFDTLTPRHGGSGRRFDWSKLRALHTAAPLLISGGIDLGMEDDILRMATDLNLYGIDINSRFETAPGIKDIDKIRTFVRSLRSGGFVKQKR